MIQIGCEGGGGHCSRVAKGNEGMPVNALVNTLGDCLRNSPGCG